MFEKIIKINPAFDKRDSDPKKNYGIHNATLFMVLKGELGAVIFSSGTGWYLPETDAWLDSCNARQNTEKEYRPRGNAVCYCSPKPLSEYQADNGRENCDWLGCTCYGGCSYSVSDEVVEILVREGSDGVWKWLENWYNQIFTPSDNPTDSIALTKIKSI